MTTRKYLAAFLLASTAFAAPVLAADISPEGADALKTSLTRYLPKDVVDTGFLKVNPQSGKYEIAVDWNLLVEKFKEPGFTINGLTPMSIFAAPKDGGLWQVDSSWPFNVNGAFEAEGKKATFDYSIASYDFTGIFDPALSFLQTQETKGKDLKFHTKAGESETTVSVGDLVSNATATRAASGGLDITSTGTLTGVEETVSDPQSGPVDVKVATVGITADVLGARINEIMALANFALEHKDKKDLTKDESDALKGMLKSAVPFWNNIEETINLDDVAVTTAMGGATLGRLAFGFHMSGATNDAEIGFSTSVENPVIPDGILPPAYMAAIPVESFIDVSMPGFHAADAANQMIDDFNFDNKEPLTPEQNAALGETFMGGDDLHVVLNNFKARNDNYDLEATGEMKVNMKQTDKVSASVTILIRDLDKTIAFLQTNAATVPEYGQAAFFAQMLKGFAVDNGDGRQKWVVDVAEDRSVKINGTAFGG